VASEYAGMISAAGRAARTTAPRCACASPPSSPTTIRKRALTQAVKTVRERVDEDGIAEPTVIQKDDQIIVELPGLAEDATARVKELIARTAKLEFKIVANNNDVMRAIFRHVGPADAPKDPEAIDQGIKAYADSWTADKSGESSSTTS
jgi:preprotein translocase subunit SecD